MKTIHWVILPALAMLLYSCDCSNKVKGRVGLTEAQKQLIPYKKGDIVKFTDQKGQTIDFNVTEQKTSWSLYDIYEGVMCTDYIHFEEKHATLTSTFDNQYIWIWLRKETSYEDINGNFDGRLRWDNSCFLEIRGSLPQWNNKQFVFYIKADTAGNFTRDVRDSIKINNHIYLNVVEENSQAEVAIGQKIPLHLFYNKDYGIIQIKVNNRNYLTLNPPTNI